MGMGHRVCRHVRLDIIQSVMTMPTYLFGRVLLFVDAGAAQLVLHAVSVLQLFDLINSDQPVLRGESFLQVLQLYVFVANLSITCSVKTRRRPEVQL